MRYQGGKNRIGKRIAEVLTSYRRPGQPYWEPFVGSCGVMIHMDGTRAGTDSREDMALLWQAVQDGWKPPQDLTREQWVALKAAKPSPERAFAGAGCSYGGRWFCSYGVDKRQGRNFCREARNGILTKAPFILGVEFGHARYQDCTPLSGMLVYCDPPYASTGNYPGMDPFDHSAFWDTVRIWSVIADVFVSEYNAPEDFECVWSTDVPSDMQGRHSKGKTRTRKIERLFRWVR